MKLLAGPRWLYYRGYIQFLSTVLANSYFLQGFKGFCYPVLNCWSCPAANFACPIGALQNASIKAHGGLVGGKPFLMLVPFDEKVDAAWASYVDL